MQIQGVATGLVAIVVAILVIGLVAVPVIEDSITGTPYEGTNLSPEYTYTYLDENPTFTWVRNGSNATLTLGGETRTVRAAGDAAIISDAISIRNTSSGAQIWNYATNTYTLVNDSAAAISLTVVSGSYTLVVDDATTTGTMTKALVMDTEGDWGRFSGSAKVTLGQTVYAGHIVAESGARGLVAVTDGTVSTFTGLYIFSGTSIAEVEATITMDYEQTGDGQAVGYYDGMTTTYNGTTDTDFRIYAPLTYESTASGDGGMNGVLLTIIPTLLIMVGIMMAVRMVREA